MATQSFPPQTPRRPSPNNPIGHGGPSFIPSLRKSSNSSLLSPKPSNHSLSSSVHSSSQPSPSPGNSAFRSIRNLLPFGQSKSAQNNQNVSRLSMDESGSGSTGFFGSLKKSRSKEGKKDFGMGGRAASVDAPVIYIHASNELPVDNTIKPSRTGSLGSSSSLSVPRFDEFGAIRELSSSPNLPDMTGTVSSLPSSSLGPDLSTIIEADTSGASLTKHLPNKSQESSFDADSTSEPDEPTVSVPLPPTSQAKIPSPHSFQQPSTPSSRDRSISREPSTTPESPALDFADIAGQVRDALQNQQKAIVSEWLNDNNSIMEQEQEHEQDEDLDLDALDTDLARILGPNPKSPPESGSSPPKDSTTRAIGMQSTPSRRALSGSLSKPTPSQTRIRPPNVYATPIISKTKRQTSPERDIPFLLKEPIELNATNLRRASLDGAAHRRRSVAPPSPLSGSSSSPQQSDSRDSLRKSSVAARLANPRSLSLRRQLIPQSSSAIDVSSPQLDSSPTSLQGRGKAVTDVDSYTDVDPADLTLRNRAFLHGSALARTRKRSASVDMRKAGKHFNGHLPPSLPRSSLDRFHTPQRVSSESGRPTADWLGPRTVKAFAAAGLLDPESQQTPRVHRNSVGESVSPVARYASVRSLGERAYSTGGSQYSPSRSSDDAVSRPGSTMSWSRVNTTSSQSNGLMESPTFTSTTPRTNFSGSTAPTSIVASSSGADYHELQMLREKHAMETEALFSALSDAQRQAKLLREENNQLRARIALLEEEVDLNRKLVDGYRNSVAPPPQPRYQNLEPPDVVSHRRSMDLNGRLPSQTHQRPRGSSQASTLSRPSSTRFPSGSSPAASRVSLQLEPAFQPTHSRRGSMTSSIFPALPSNMTMLVNERVDRTGLDISASFQQPLPLREVRNASPDTVDFSMTTTGGSPKSLSLRPEHEAHLGDMDVLSLNMSYRDEGASIHGWN